MVIVEIDDALAKVAGRLAVEHYLRTLDALHLAAAQRIYGDDLRLATYDERMRRGALAMGIRVLPE